MSHKVEYRLAKRADVKALVSMLTDDELGKLREDNSSVLPESYYSAFAEIDRDPNNLLIVAEVCDVIVGMLQITYIPYLTYQGGWRALIEGVRISSDYRGEGLGKCLFHMAISKAKEKGCHIVQLTSDKKRPRAIKFYEELGFVSSHEGMKLHL